MNITITPENQSVVSKFMRADMACQNLADLGFTVLDTSIQYGKISIRIAYHGACDSLIKAGQAAYIYVSGVKQGVYNFGECRVYWSESFC